MLDVSIRVGVLNLLKDLHERLGIAILYITHDIASARYFADRTHVMYAGRTVETGDSESVTQTPAHPYTQLLIRSAPDPENLARQGRADAKGEPPNLCGHRPDAGSIPAARSPPNCAEQRLRSCSRSRRDDRSRAGATRRRFPVRSTASPTGRSCRTSATPR